MKENDLHEKKRSKDSERKSKDKSRDEGKDRKSKSRELASVDIFSKSMDNSEDESSSKKRSRDEDRDDYSKSKRSKSDTSQKFVLPAPPAFMPPLPTGPSLIPEISPVYKPLPRLPLQNMDRVLDERNTDEESLSILLSNKNKNRAAIYRYCNKILRFRIHVLVSVEQRERVSLVLSPPCLTNVSRCLRIMWMRLTRLATLVMTS